MTTLILLVGPPASGKSSWAENYFADTSVSDTWGYVNLDVLRWMLTGDAANQDHNQTVVTLAHERILNYATQGFSVVYDATNLKAAYRQPVIDLWPWDEKIAHLFLTPLRICLERNNDRFLTVPEHVLLNMFERFQNVLRDRELEKEGFEVILH